MSYLDYDILNEMIDALTLGIEPIDPNELQAIIDDYEE